MVDSVQCKTTFVAPETKLNEKAPKFYMFLGKDDNGRDQYVNKVPVLKKDGTIQLDAAGNPVRRFVGPQDLVQGAIVRPVFQLVKVYQVQSFGVHMFLHSVYIKPPPPKPTVEIEGAAIVENYDPLIAARVLHQTAESAGAVDDAPASETESITEDGPAVAVPALSLNFDDGQTEQSQTEQSFRSPISKKRKESEAPNAPSKVKKNRSSAVLEEA
jgi:hypothetical protein